MRCPYCDDDRILLSNEHPYPYIVSGKREVLQLIDRWVCINCNNPFFFEKRNGTTMGLDNKMYYQIYKSGLYKYRYTGGI